MIDEERNTKTSLILTAGPLFADKGVDGVSIREITRLAETNVAGVNYHFGNKEHLYVATVRYALEKLEDICFHRLWAALPANCRQIEQLPDALADILRTMFETIFKERYPQWYFGLLCREFQSPASAFPLIEQEYVLPCRRAIQEVFAACGQSRTQVGREFWFHTILGHAFFLAATYKGLKKIYRWGEGNEWQIAEPSFRSLIRQMVSEFGAGEEHPLPTRPAVQK